MTRSVAIFRSELLPYSQTFVRAQALALRRWKPVLVGASLDPGGLPLDGLGIRIIPRSRGSLLRTFDTARYWLNRPNDKLVRVLKELRVELVHVHFGTDAVDIAASVMEAGLPMLVTLHGFDVTTESHWWRSGKGGLRRRAYPSRLRALARNPRVKFLAVSRFLQDLAVDAGIANGRIDVHYTGVDTAFFRPPPSSRSVTRSTQICFIGRLLPNKGARILLDAFLEVRKHHPSATLRIIGDGPEYGELVNYASRLGPAVSFAGAVPPAIVRDELWRSAVLCHPSQRIGSGASEALGMVLLEAQACGVPVISSSRAGINEGMLERVTGYGFAEGDSAALATAIIGVLADPHRSETMSAQAVEFVRTKFDLARNTSALEDRYDDLVREHNTLAG